MVLCWLNLWLQKNHRHGGPTVNCMWINTALFKPNGCFLQEQQFSSPCQRLLPLLQLNLPLLPSYKDPVITLRAHPDNLPLSRSLITSTKSFLPCQVRDEDMHILRG